MPIKTAGLAYSILFNLLELSKPGTVAQTPLTQQSHRSYTQYPVLIILLELIATPLQLPTPAILPFVKCHPWDLWEKLCMSARVLAARIPLSLSFPSPCPPKNAQLLLQFTYAKSLPFYQPRFQPQLQQTRDSPLELVNNQSVSLNFFPSRQRKLGFAPNSLLVKSDPRKNFLFPLRMQTNVTHSSQVKLNQLNCFQFQ